MGIPQVLLQLLHLVCPSPTTALVEVSLVHQRPAQKHLPGKAISNPTFLIPAGLLPLQYIVKVAYGKYVVKYLLFM